MDRQTIETRLLGDSKFYGQLAGVWPNQNKFTKYIIRIVITVIIILTNAAQMSRVIVFYSLNVLTDQMPFLSLGFGIILKQYNYILNESKLRELLNCIVSDRLMERPKEELAILELYSKKAVLLSSIYKVSIYFSLTMFLLLPFVPPILDIVSPLNESRNHVFIYPSYYFVDEQQYYYTIQLHMMVSGIILSWVFIACDVNLVHAVQHACALLAIAGYRFKHAMDDPDFYNEKCSGALKDKCYAKVSQSIDAHKTAIEYLEKIEACHLHYILLLTGLIIMAFTVTLVKLTTMEIGTTYITFCAFITSQLVHVFFLTILGQFAIDSNEEVFQKICEAEWYNGSTKTRALFLLVLRKCLNPPKLTGGGLLALNLDSFVQILKTSISYYTVFKSSA